MSEIKWIPCSERLPNTTAWHTDYLVTVRALCYKPPFTTYGVWENTNVRGKPVSRWKNKFNTLMPYEVVAWAELPEPYNELEGKK